MSKILNGLPDKHLDIPEEGQLAAAIQSKQPHAEDAIYTLVLHNMREALPYAMHCCRAKLGEDEVYSLCYTALVKAARNFAPASHANIRFFGYAKPYVRGEISRTWKEKDVVKSCSKHSEGSPSRLIQNKYDGEREAEQLLITEDEEPLEADYAEPEFKIIDIREKWNLVAPLIQSILNERERTVLRLYYEAGFSFEKIGDMLVPSVSRAAVQSTHCRAIQKIRGSLIQSKKLKI